VTLMKLRKWYEPGGAVNAWSPLRRNVSIESWMAKEKSVAPIAGLVRVRGASQDITESKCIEFKCGSVVANWHMSRARMRAKI